ncbi:Ldh family oxidoreductase [Bacillaceae bacterium]
MSKGTARIPKQALEDFVREIFLAVGLDDEQSAIIARHLVLANLRGVDSHGVSRVDIYTRRLDAGIVSKTYNGKIVRENFASALIDAGNSSGIVAATKGIELAVKKAKEVGVGVVGIKHSNHCGMLADYTLYAVNNDCIAIATTNAPANMAPWGGKERFFGTNPFSYGIPAGQEIDIVFDMATSIVARGKIILAKKNHLSIPLGWAISKEGKPTTDPDEALEGLVLPVGGAKGYGITFFVEAMSAVFTGAAFGPHVGDLYNDFSRPQDVGQFFFAMRADLFQPIGEFKQRMDEMIRAIRKIPLMEGVERIYLPGEIELLKTAEREVKGIPVSKEVLNELQAVAARYGVSKQLLKNAV